MNTAEGLNGEEEEEEEQQPPSLEALVESITFLVGTPHNYSVTEPPPPAPQDDAAQASATAEEEDAVQRLASTVSAAVDYAPSPEEV